MARVLSSIVRLRRSEAVDLGVLYALSHVLQLEVYGQVASKEAEKLFLLYRLLCPR
jgi:hypothetical protein